LGGFAGEAVVWQRAEADGRGSVTGARRGYGTVSDLDSGWEGMGLAMGVSVGETGGGSAGREGAATSH